MLHRFFPRHMFVLCTSVLGTDQCVSNRLQNRGRRVPILRKARLQQRVAFSHVYVGHIHRAVHEGKPKTYGDWKQEHPDGSMRDFLYARQQDQERDVAYSRARANQFAHELADYLGRFGVSRHMFKLVRGNNAKLFQFLSPEAVFRPSVVADGMMNNEAKNNMEAFYKNIVQNEWSTHEAKFVRAWFDADYVYDATFEVRGHDQTVGLDRSHQRRSLYRCVGSVQTKSKHCRRLYGVFVGYFEKHFRSKRQLPLRRRGFGQRRRAWAGAKKPVRVHFAECGHEVRQNLWTSISRAHPRRVGCGIQPRHERQCRLVHHDHVQPVYVCRRTYTLGKSKRRLWHLLHIRYARGLFVLSWKVESVLRLWAERKREKRRVYARQRRI